MAQPYTAADYLAALKSLFPPGRVWRADPGSTQEAVLRAIGAGMARLDTAAIALLVDAFPATADALLPEWEESLDLPDPCAGESPTLQQRQAQVIARLANTGGQSAAFFQAYAAQLGFKVTVKNYAPFQVGQGTAGQAVNGEAWAYVWSVTAPLVNLTEFRAGQSAAGEPLAAWGNAVLECELQALKPAHTTLLILYD